MNSTHTYISKCFVSIERITLLVISVSLLTVNAFAGNYTWTGSTSSSWTTTTNWSPNGNPSTNDTVTVKTGTNNCVMAANTTVKQFTLASDTLDFNSYTLTVTENATISDGFATNGTLTVNCNGSATFSGGKVAVTLNVTAAKIYFSGSAFSSAVTAIKKGASSSAGDGGSKFSSTLTLIDSSSGTWTFAFTNPDSCSDKVSVTEASTGNIYFAHKATGNSFSKSVTFTNTSSGEIYCDYYGSSVFHDSLLVNATGSGAVFFGEGDGTTTLDTSIIAIGSSGLSSSAKLSLMGIDQQDATKSISLSGTGSSAIMFAGGNTFAGRVTASAPGVLFKSTTFNGVTSLTNTGSGTTSSPGNCHFTDSAVITHNNSSGGVLYIGVIKADIFDAPVTIVNANHGKVGVIKATFNDNTFFINHAKISGTIGVPTNLTAGYTFLVGDGGSCDFEDSLTIFCDTSSMAFGTSNGEVEFGHSSQLLVDSDYVGNLFLTNVNYGSSSEIDFPFDYNSGLLLLDTNNFFGADVKCNVRRIQLNGSDFHDSFYLKTTCQDYDTSKGGNVFNGTTTFIDSNMAAAKVMVMASRYADDFNGDVTFKQYGTGKIYPSYTRNSTFSGELSVDGTSDIEFGKGGGRVVIDGGAEHGYTMLGTYKAIIKKLEINKTGGLFSLKDALSVKDTVFFTKGYLAADSLRPLIIPDSGVVTGASESSFVIGLVKKVGNDAFTFPLGSDDGYHALSITAPSNVTDTLAAEYFSSNSGIPDGNPYDTIDVDTCQYWRLRNYSNSGVKTSLWFGNLCSPVDTSRMVVMEHNGTAWQNRGRSGGTSAMVTAHDTSFFLTAGDVDVYVPGRYPVLDTMLVTNDTINKWEKYEMSFKLPRKYEQAVDSFFMHYYFTGGVIDTADLNPYADDSLVVRIDLTSPSNTHYTKWAFYMKEAKWFDDNGDEDTLMADSASVYFDHHWHFRFAPEITGNWHYTISLSTPKWNTPLPAWTFGPYNFNVQSPLTDNHGFLKKSSNNQFLKFEDGTPFFGIGENLNGSHGFWNNHSKWPNDCDNLFHRLTYNSYLKTFDEMHEVGANFVRTVFLRNNFSFDRSNLGVYDQFLDSMPICAPYSCGGNTVTESGNKQFKLRMLDSLFDKARETGIYFELMIDYEMPAHAYQSFHWGDNAYIKYLYGHYNYSSKRDSMGLNYFSDSTLRYYFKRKYKYLMSRYGYSVNLGIVQPLNEIEIAIGFKKNYFSNTNCLPDTDKTYYYPVVSGVKDSVNSWLNDVIGYVKNPVSSGGLGDTNHLFEISYAGLSSIDTAGYGSFSNYYSLYSNNYLDVMGVSSYFDNQNMMTTRSGVTKSISDTFPLKPLHITEGSSFGYILLPNASTPSTAERYNNYDITFHNELWASAFMGGFTTLNSWLGEVVHRWKWATNENYGEVKTLHVDSAGNSRDINETMNSFYHNFKPLTDFVSLLSFNQSYIPSQYYGGTTNYIESYFLKKIDTTNVVGWIHNINRYWDNFYYFTYDSAGQNKIKEHYYKCDLLPSPSTIFNLPGLKHNFTYYIYFFRTRIGSQVVPATDTIISDNLGNLTIDLSYSPLGCDSMNADYAFWITDAPLDFSNMRKAQISNQPKRVFNVNIAPNPTSGELRISITGGEKSETHVIEVIDVTGKSIFKKEINSNITYLNLSDEPRGIYYLRVLSHNNSAFKKIVLL